MKSASTPSVVLPVAVKFRVFTALLTVRLVQDMSARTPPEFSRAATRESTAEIAAAVAKRPSASVLLQALPVSSVTCGSKGRSGEDASQLFGHGVGVANYCEHFAGAGVCVGDQVAPVQGACVACAAEIPAIGLRLAISIAAELCYGS